MCKVLLVIDVQNDYFPGGNFPLWNTEKVLENCIQLIEEATAQNTPIVYIQHIADVSKGKSPFFNEGTEGVKIHPRILQVAPNAPVVVKSYADSFYQTNLEQVLSEIGATELLISGMMTQNCVTHTAISEAAKKYRVKVIKDCCTTINQAIHLMAIGAMAIRTEVINADQVNFKI